MTATGGWSERVAWLLPVILGLAVGVLVTFGVKWVALAFVGLAVTIVGVTYPVTLVALMWLALLMDRAGVTGQKIGEFPITASKLAVVGSLGLWSLHAVLGRAKWIRWHAVLWALLGVVAAMAFCIAVANCLKVGKFDLYGIGMMIVMVALVFAILAEAALQPLYRFLGVLFVGALALSLTGGGAGAGEAARATGTMGDPNEWATLVLLTTPFLLGGLADEYRAPWWIVRVALVLLAPAAIFVSGSRSALAVGVLISPFALYLLRKQTGELVLAACIALVASPFLLTRDTLLYRMQLLWDNLRGAAVIHDDSLAERTELFEQGKALFLDHLWFGAGPGMFERETGFISESGKLRPAHNTYLEIASEQGFVGLFATAVFIVTVVWSLRSALLMAGSTPAKHRIIGVGLGLFALCAMAATLGLITFSTGYLVLGFGLALTHQARHGLVR